MKSPIQIIINKELARVFGDKKLVFSLFIMPALLVIGIYSFMGSAMTKMMTDIEEHQPTIYISNAPEGFDAFVTQTGMQATTKYVDAAEAKRVKEQVLQGDVDLYLVFEENFLEKIATYENGMEIPEIKTYYNPAEDYSTEARSKFLTEILEPYRQLLLADRIGDLAQLQVFVIDKDPESSVIMEEGQASGKMLGMIVPYLVVMLLFTGPMSLGIDAITGEKERGTLASMLVSPAKRSEIVLGKLLALSILSCLYALVYAISLGISVPRLYGSLGEMEGTGGFSVSLVQILELLVIMLTLVYLYVSIVAAISVFARTAKEASTYVSPAYIVITIAGVFTMFAGNREQAFGMFGIPVYGSAIAMQKLFVNELTGAQFGISVCSNLLAAAIFTVIITKAFQSEKVMLNA